MSTSGTVEAAASQFIARRARRSGNQGNSHTAIERTNISRYNRLRRPSSLFRRAAFTVCCVIIIIILLVAAAAQTAASVSEAAPALTTVFTYLMLDVFIAF